MKNNFVIVHGSFGNSKEHYLPWLKQKLEEYAGVGSVICLDYPIGVGVQTFDSWAKTLDAYKENITNDTVFIGRSIAPIFIAKYLLKNNQKIKALFAISPFNNLTDIPAEEYNIVNSTFYVNNLSDFTKLCDNVTCYISKNDPFVPYKYLTEFSKDVNAKVVLRENAGHFNTDSGYTTFEELLNDIIACTKL